MRITVRNDIIFFFIIAMITGSFACAQMDQNLCAVKVYVNDPYAKIYVDNVVIGSSPQIIDCSQKERTVTVKSSDGQIFSRLIKSYYNEYPSNSALNVIFHKKINAFIDPSAAVQSAKSETETSSVVVRDMASYPVQAAPSVESASPPVIKEEKSVAAKLSGFFVQIFALKNLDLYKVGKDIQEQYQSKVSEKDIVVCSRRGSSKTQISSLVLVGPFKDKSSAFAERNRIGGASFVVSDLFCLDDSQKVNR
ncbi:hypothetical protein K2X05_07890 [bacterium]|nr:hypothetical protein [bacterium]